MNGSGALAALLVVWNFLIENWPGLIVLTLAGTGGCWFGIQLADRINQRFMDRHAMYPIDYAKAKLLRVGRK